MNSPVTDQRAETIGSGSIASAAGSGSGGINTSKPGGRSTPVTTATTMMKPVESSGNLSTASGRSDPGTGNDVPNAPAVPYEVRSRTRSGGSAHSGGRSSTPVSQYERSVAPQAAAAAPQASLMAPTTSTRIGELLTESDAARGERQRRYQEQQQSAQGQQPRPRDGKAAQQPQRPGHSRKRTWSAPAGTVEHFMSTAAAAAAVGGPAATTRATAHNTPVKSKHADDGEAASSGRGGYGRHYYHGDLLSDSFGRSESYDDFDDDMVGLDGGGGGVLSGVVSGNRDTSGNAPATPVVVEEADRGGGHGQAHHSQGESSFPDLLPSGFIDLGVDLGVDGGGGGGAGDAAASTPPRHYRRPRTLSDVGSLASRASPSMPRILHRLGYRLSRASPRGRHHSVGVTYPGEDAEPSFVNDEDADGNGGLAMPSLGVTSNSRDDTTNDGTNRPRPSRDSNGRIRRSVSARTLINLGRLGGVETVLNGDRADTSTSEPLNVDLQQIATAAVDAEDDMIADVAQTSMARQAADGGTSHEQETLVKELIAYFRYRPWKKKVLMLTVIGSVIWVVIDFATTGYIRSFLATFVSWMERNPVGGFFVFIIFFILTTRELLRGILLCSLCCLFYRTKSSLTLSLFVSSSPSRLYSSINLDSGEWGSILQSLWSWTRSRFGSLVKLCRCLHRCCHCFLSGKISHA